MHSELSAATLFDGDEYRTTFLKLKSLHNKQLTNKREVQYLHLQV